MWTPAASDTAFVLDVVPRLEQQARQARADLRAHEQATGKAADQHGTYWLARTTALEHIAEAARQTLRTGNTEHLREPLEVLRTIPAPACNPCDHQAARGGCP